MLQMVTDVFFTYFLGGPIEGNLEVTSVYNMVAVVFLPLAMVEMRHEHICVDLFMRLFPQWIQRIVNVVGYLISAAFFAVLGYQTLLDGIHSYVKDEIMMGVVQVTIWPARFFLPIGFFAIMLAVLLHAYQAARDPRFDPSPQAPDVIADPS